MIISHSNFCIWNWLSSVLSDKFPALRKNVICETNVYSFLKAFQTQHINIMWSSRNFCNLSAGIPVIKEHDWLQSTLFTPQRVKGHSRNIRRKRWNVKNVPELQFPFFSFSRANMQFRCNLIRVSCVDTPHDHPLALYGENNLEMILLK